MKQSNFLSLGWRDFLRGLAIAILTPTIAVITDSLESGEWHLNWRLIALSAIAGAGAYLLKNLFTKPDALKVYSDEVQIGGTVPPIGKDEK